MPVDLCDKVSYHLYDIELLMKFLKKAASFTVRSDLLQWLDKTAKIRKTNRSRLIEKALESMRKQEMQSELAHSFHKMSTDQEMKDLAEMGLEDFLEATDEEYPTR